MQKKEDLVENIENQQSMTTKRPDDLLQESGEDHPVVEDVDAPIEVTLEPAAAADA